MLNVLSELNTLNIKFKETDTQYILDCPVCHKENHAYINKETGLWDCKVCGAKGNMYQFKNHKGNNTPIVSSTVLSIETVNQFAKNLLGNQKLLDYLQGRKIAKHVIVSERIGCNKYGDITIPYFNSEGDVVAIKVRKMDYDTKLRQYEEDLANGIKTDKPDKWYTLGKVGLYGQPKDKQVLLCEGEWDRLAALTYGIGNAVSSPGCSNSTWVDELKMATEIFICYDTDIPGQAGAFEIASRLGLGRCKNVKLPLKDLNDCLIAGIPFSTIKETILAAELFPIPGMQSVDRWTDDIVWDFSHTGELKGYPTGHERLDKMTRGFTGGQIRVLSGFTSAGKTTWTMNEMLQYAKQDIPSAIFCFESDQKDVIFNMLQCLHGKKFNSEEEVRQRVSQLKSLPIKIFDEKNFTESFNVMKFKEVVKNTRDRWGTKFVVLDNVQFLLNFDHRKCSFDEKVTELMTDLKNLAKSLDIHIVCMVHLNRAAYGLKDKTGVRQIQRPQINDLKGSSGYEQTADIVMFVHRDTSFDAPDEIKNEVEIIIAKNRPGKGITGVIPFRYDPDTATYKECQ